MHFKKTLTYAPASNDIGMFGKDIILQGVIKIYCIMCKIGYIIDSFFVYGII